MKDIDVTYLRSRDPKPQNWWSLDRIDPLSLAIFSVALSAFALGFSLAAWLV